MRIFAIIFTLLLGLPAMADVSSSQQKLSELKSQGIENATDPKIRELYEKLNSQISEYNNIEQKYLDDIQANADAMREKEQSTENKLLGAAGMGAAGIGGMQVASALAEKNADADAERDMAAYLATFRCDYGHGLNIKGGETGIELPGANNLIPLYQEYVNLANDLKVRKNALGMKPGIESEKILDAATSGLYDNQSIGKVDGAFTSLARALSDPSGADAAEWAAQTDDTAKKLKTGATVAGVGVVGSAVANLIVNKDAPKESSDKIKREFDSNRQKLESEISDTELQLDNAITDNKKRIAEYNALLNEHQAFVATITETDCIEQFREYIDYINSLKPITDDFADTTDLTIKYDLDEQKAAYTQCVDAAILKRKIQECESKPHHKWENNTCVDHTPPPPVSNDNNDNDGNNNTNNDDNNDNTNGNGGGNDNNDNDNNDNTNNGNTNNNGAGDDNNTEQTDPNADPNACPAVNPRLSTLNETSRVGDFCSYGNVSEGYVFKVKSGKDAGTCSCSAKACMIGYKLERGRCVEDPDANKPVAPENSNVKTDVPTPPELKYYAVCKDERGKSGTKNEYCIDEPFNWINVQMLQATALAAEYAYVHNKHNVQCQNTYRQSGNDDWFSCTSTDNKHFYEFKFDDVAESLDTDIQVSLRKALCNNIYGGTLMASGNTGSQLCKLADKSKREMLAKRAPQFGIPGVSSSNEGVRFGSSYNLSYTTKKIPNVDPFAFYSGDIQIRANGQMIDGIYEYVATQLAPQQIKKFTCNRTPIQVQKTVDGIKTKGTTDDVLKCFADGTEVDFVFDDMSELSKTLSYGGYSNMNCTVVGGAFNGKECMNVGKLQCERIKKMAANDPVAKQAKWNSSTNRCELPAAADATQMQQNINIGIMVGGVIVGVVVTVATGGTAAPALALLAVETVGGAIEINQTQKIYNAIDTFLTESQKCRDATCAEKILKADLQRISNMTFDMTDAQINGVDSELARLASLIPVDSEFYKKIAQNGPTTADNSLGFFDANSWEPEQIWRAVGIAMQMASLVTSIGKWIAGKVNKLPKATKAIAQRATRTTTKVEMTATQAKRLDEIDARLPKIQSELDANPSASRASELRTERTRLTQEKNTILNKVGTKDADEVAAAKTAARSAKEVADAQKELDDARSALQKRLDWEAKQSPGALKNDLQSRSSVGRTARDKVRAAEQKLRDMGETVTPMEFRSVDDILGNTTTGASTATRNTDNVAGATDNAASTADNAASTTDNATSTADNAASNTDNAAGNTDNAAGTTDNAASNTDNAAGTSTADNVASTTDNNKFIELQNKSIHYAQNPGGTFYNPKASLTDSQWDDLNKSIEHTGFKWVPEGQFMRLVTKPFDFISASKNFTGTVAKHKVFLENLPTINGSSAPVVNIKGRAVVVVNIDGHRLPFYVSSGQAGKDAIGIASGKWYPIAGIGENGNGWFNKMPDMLNNPIPELDDIVNRLNRYFDAQTLKKMALSEGNIPEPNLDAAAKIINAEFPNGVVSKLESIPNRPGTGKMRPEDKPLYNANIKIIENIFK